MPALRDYLATRRTVPANQLAGPRPDADTLNAMLEIACRVPDHGKLAPWRFIIFEGDVRETLGARFAQIADALDDPQRRAQEEQRFLRAPLVVAVVSAAAQHPKIPIWEQQLAAGAVCLNLLHAAQAYGYSAQWLTEWMAYDDAAKTLLGIEPHENVAGFIHIGTPTVPPTERTRPSLPTLVTHFSLPDASADTTA